MSSKQRPAGLRRVGDERRALARSATGASFLMKARMAGPRAASGSLSPVQASRPWSASSRLVCCSVLVAGLWACHGAARPDERPSGGDVSSQKAAGEAPEGEEAAAPVGGPQAPSEGGVTDEAVEAEAGEVLVEEMEGEDDALDPDDVEVYEDFGDEGDPGEVSLTFTDDVDYPAYVVAEGFPAISADGERVAVIDVDDDGARGNPNATLRIHQTSDGAVEASYVLLEAEEFSSVAEEALPELIIPRVDAARAALEKRSWRPMVALEVVDRRGVNGGASSVFTGPLVSSEEDEPRLSLTLKARTLKISLDGDEVLSRDVGAWSAPAPSEDMASCEGKNPMTLLGGFWDEARRVVTLEVGYLGSDECWGPDSEFHVLKY